MFQRSALYAGERVDGHGIRMLGHGGKGEEHVDAVLVTFTQTDDTAAANGYACFAHVVDAS